MGTVLALGFYLGVRKIATGTVLALVPNPHEWWLSLNGLVAVYASQSVAVVFGAVVASAGRVRGFAHGLAVGLVCGLLFLGFELLGGVPPRSLVIYLQPPVLALLGLIAGVVGARVWASAPMLDIPLPNPSKLSSIQLSTDASTNTARPTAWLRVIVGALVMVCGAMASDTVRSVTQKNSAGLLQVQSRVEGDFVTWQMATFAILLGGVIAGAATGAGLRHGIFAGAVGGLAILGICLKQGTAIPAIAYGLECTPMGGWPIDNPTVCFFVAGSILLVAVVGGWLGGALFQPLAPVELQRRIRLGMD
jgi:hypothetical protein